MRVRKSGLFIGYRIQPRGSGWAWMARRGVLQAFGVKDTYPAARAEIDERVKEG